MNPEDVLIGIAYTLPQQRRSFEFDSEKFNDFFHQQRRDFPELLGDWNFEWKKDQYASVENAVYNLAATRHIILPDKSPEYYHFSKLCQQSFERAGDERFSGLQLIQLWCLTQRFNKQIATQQIVDC